MKTIITIVALLCMAVTVATASEITPTSTPASSTRPAYLTAPKQATPYYRMTWMIVVRGGVNVNVRKAFVYSAGTTEDIDNMYCATTYAEMKAKATALGITIPAQVTGQP